MSETSEILIVDDTDDSRMLLTVLLEDNYRIAEAASGAACLQLLEQHMPDLVLLDVNMPDMSGYEVCSALRKKKATKHLPIIFVSALDSPEERLAGFEAGADDYLIKPIDSEQLMDKVESCLQRQRDYKQAKSSASDAMNMAMEAMTVSSELGKIVQFVKDIAITKTPREVGLAILTIAEDLDLDVALRIQTDECCYVGCEEGSMEALVLERFANHSERIVSVGVRTVIRSQSSEMLIKDMPMEDQNRYGRLKDHLAILMDIADGHLAMLKTQAGVVKQRDLLLKEIIHLAEEQIKVTSAQIERHDAKTQEIMQGMFSSMEKMLFGLGLDDDQERSLLRLADEASIQLQQASNTSQDLGADLGGILESLYQLLKK